ncbi:hypothetical protein, partial [Mycobacterium tuberculosis]|uniref:hypothetical protein n=1 Tax=Mycobacterium tuberculosis TaxID=1773 RepID=UPI00207301E8
MVMTWGHLPLAGDCARLRRACDHHWFDGDDLGAPALPRLRGTAPGFAALAIITGSMVMTRCARLRRACDHHWFDGDDPLRPASPRLRSSLV